MNNVLQDLELQQNRRTFLRQGSAGLGSLALGMMLSDSARASHSPVSRADEDNRWTGVLDKLHYPQKIKRVIHLYMAGGPSHLETLDYKPKLAEMNNQPMPKSFTEGQQIAQLQGQRENLKCLGPQH